MKNFPLCNYKAPVVLGDGSLPYQTKIIEHKGLPIEITSIADKDNGEVKAVMYRAHSRVLDFCQDYGGFVVDHGRVVGCLVADGVGSVSLSQEVAYQVVDQSARQLEELVNMGLGINSQLIKGVWRANLFPNWDLTDYVDGERIKVETHPEYYVFGADGMIGDVEVILEQGPKNFLGATTLFTALKSPRTLHTMNIGDCGGAVVGDQVKSVYGGSDDFYRKTPNQIGTWGNDNWGLSRNGVDYEQTVISENDLLAFFSDGCLKKGHTTSEAVADLLFSLRSDDLESFGLELFDELAITKGAIFGKEQQWGLPDDATLVLLKN
jgi:hypothetical protein